MLPPIHRVLGTLILASIGSAVGTRTSAAQCLDWADGQVPPAGGLVGAPSDSILFDDGTGPAYYVTPFALGPNTSGIGRWDGTTWSAVGGATDQGATCFGIYDD